MLLRKRRQVFDRIVDEHLVRMCEDVLHDPAQLLIPYVNSCSVEAQAGLGD